MIFMNIFFIKYFLLSIGQKLQIIIKKIIKAFIVKNYLSMLSLHTINFIMIKKFGLKK